MRTSYAGTRIFIIKERKNKMRKSKKIISIFIIMIILLSSIQNVAFGAATTLNSMKIIKGNAIKTNVAFDGYEVKANYVYYVDENNQKYPAYCITHGYNGVEETGNYEVDIYGMLKDDKVWRVLTNGYPYQPLEGLTNEEAYFATKQAIYCVILAGRTASQYTGLNEKGKQIVKAIKKLEDIGENGTQKYDNYNVTIDTQDPLKQDGDYWYKTIKIGSNAKIKNVKITKISNFPEGSFISDMQGNKKTIFNSGENARIMIPKSKLNQDINGTIKFIAELKTYPILYGKTRIPGTQDYVITGDGYFNSTSVIEVSEKLNKGQLLVNKVDGKTSKPIEGVTFELLKDGNKIATTKTNKNGQAIFSNLYQGNYQIKEVNTLDSYILNSELIDVKVEYGIESNVTIKNYYKTGNLQINKIDDKTSKPIQGVTFELTDLNDNVIEKGTTDEKGQLIFSNLKIGKYKLKEVKAPENYILNTDFIDVEIQYNNTNILNVKNELKKGRIEITKISADDNPITNEKKGSLLNGAIFEIYTEKGELVDTVTIKENGKEMSKLLECGNYEIKEKSTGSEYYVLNKQIYNVTIKENGEIVPITIANKSVEIPKTPPEEGKTENPPKKEEIPQKPPKNEVEVPKEPIQEEIEKTEKEVVKKLPKTGF